MAIGMLLAAVAGLLLDLAEDVGLICIVLGYPTIRYVWIAESVAWCTLGKYCCWAVLAVVDAVLGIRYLIYGVDKLSIE